MARAHREADPTITNVYWFRHNQEVRLVEVDASVPSSPDGKVHPFRFRPSPEDRLFAPSDVALVSPDELGKAELPEGWGPWGKAEKLL